MVLAETGSFFTVNLTMQPQTMNNTFEVDNCSGSCKSLITRTSLNSNSCKYLPFSEKHGKLFQRDLKSVFTIPPAVATFQLKYFIKKCERGFSSCEEFG